MHAMPPPKRQRLARGMDAIPADDKAMPTNQEHSSYGERWAVCNMHYLCKSNVNNKLNSR